MYGGIPPVLDSEASIAGPSTPPHRRQSQPSSPHPAAGDLAACPPAARPRHNDALAGTVPAFAAEKHHLPALTRSAPTMIRRASASGGMTPDEDAVADTPRASSDPGAGQGDHTRVNSATSDREKDVDMERKGSGGGGGGGSKAGSQLHIPHLPEYIHNHTCDAPWHTRIGWAGWMADTVTTKTMVPSLVLQAFATGVLDATTYADFMTFASNQTGNTILLTVSIVGTTPVLIVLTAISLGTFLACAGIFGHLGHYMGTRRRSWLIITNVCQLAALLVAALLLSVAPPRFYVGGEHEWLALALFAGMSGAQVAQARQSGSQELPTAPMTSSYVDLMADKHLFKGFRHPDAGPRNRRLAYITAMIIGAMLGAVVHHHAGSWEVVVLTMGLKACVLGMVCVMKGEPRKTAVACAPGNA